MWWMQRMNPIRKFARKFRRLVRLVSSHYRGPTKSRLSEGAIRSEPYRLLSHKSGVARLPAQAAAPCERPALAPSGVGTQGRAAMSQEEIEAIKARAREMLLGRNGVVPAPEYPAHALGVLAPACRVIAEDGQLRSAMAGQALLGTAALLVQNGYVAENAPEGELPLSLFLFTQALSGDGKSVAERSALKEVRAYEREGAASGEKWRQLTTKDATIEAIVQILENSESGSLGLFTSEGGSFFAGYGLSDPVRAVATVARFITIFDEACISIARATSRQNINLVERYLSMHVLVQPGSTAGMFLNPTLSDSGFLPRVLLSIPQESLPRKARRVKPAERQELVQYYNRCRELLDMQRRNGAAKTLLTFEPAAQVLMDESFEHFEREAREGSLSTIRPFAIRAPELIRRVAGVLTAFANRATINAETVAGARELVEYSLACWKHVFDKHPEERTFAAAYKVVEYLASKGGEYPEQLVWKDGPPATRLKAQNRPVVSLLLSLGLVEREGRVLRLSR